MKLCAESCPTARRKEVDHLNLFSQICEQLRDRFHPTMSEIKKHIDALIDKEVYILSLRANMMQWICICLFVFKLS